MKQPAGLISVLLDKSASEAERHDAAMDLCKYNEESALQALLSIAQNFEEDPFIIDMCGESIAEIWIRNNSFDIKAYKKLHPLAQHEVKDYIQTQKPEWLKLI